MDPQGDAQDNQIVEDSTPELETDSEDSASDKKGDKHAAAELEDDIVDDVIPPSPGKIRTRGKVPSACQIFGLVSLWKMKLHNFGFHGLNRCEFGQVVRTEFWIDCHPEERVAFGR